MEELPFHPSVVHIPIGVAVVLPLVLAGIGAADARAALGFVLVIGAFAALRTGEADEERIEPLVPEVAIEEHEAAGEAMLAGAIVTAVLAASAAFVSRRRVAPSLMAVATVGSAATLAAVIQTGHLGGELVYSHGGAGAYARRAPAAGAAPEPRARPEPDDDGRRRQRAPQFEGRRGRARAATEGRRGADASGPST